jgi:AGCS family alanine or glycine:cation symporter
MPWIIGGVVAIAVGYCLFGGGKRLVKITGVLVPIMGVIYILVALVLTLLNVTSLPSVFARIFTEAFDLTAIFGGFTGSCVMLGIQRGLYSNEAGIGSAPNASASAEVSHPARQGLVQVLSVFIDTLLICSATAFMCLSSGVEPTAELSGAAYVQAAMTENLGAVGPIFISIAMVLFAFTTLIGNMYYVDRCIIHLCGKEPSKTLKYVIYVAASLLIFVGAGLSAGLLWGVADVAMGLMALINIPVIAILGHYAYKALKDYDKQRKSGKKPVFLAKEVGLEGKTDYWQEDSNPSGEE